MAKLIKCVFIYMHKPNFMQFFISLLLLSPIYLSRSIPVGIVTRVRTGRPGFDFRQGWGLFLLAIVSRQFLGSTPSPVQWVQGILSSGLKWPGHEVDHSSSSSAEVKNVWSYTSSPQYVYRRSLEQKSQVPQSHRVMDLHVTAIQPLFAVRFMKTGL
jgi:hypothetical protein